MTDPHTLEALCNALGWQGGTIHDAINMVRAHREQCANLAELIEEFIAITTQHPNDIAPEPLIARARQLLDTPVQPALHSDRRLAVLTHPLPKISALLLESLRVTHADVLTLGAITHAEQNGLAAELGDFTHTPTGRRYFISVMTQQEAPHAD